jgi:hypothetical protein
MKRIALCAWAALLTTTSPVPAQDKPVEKAPGKRLRVEFRETRDKDGTTTATRSYALLLHADAAPAYVFVGPVVAMTTSNQGTLTTQFKNAGVKAEVSVSTVPDGGYSLEASFENSSPLGSGGAVTGIRAADNPILTVVKARSRPLRVREGETVSFASAVDPATGEVVRVDVTVRAAPEAKLPAVRAGGSPRLRARLMLVRRQGGTTVARRPYSLVVTADGDRSEAEAFGGSQLPVQTPVQGQPTVMLKDLGAGLQVGAQRVPDGRIRLDLRFSDGVLSSAEGSPRMHVFESESKLFVREGETLEVASAVDPKSGERVEAELTLEAEKADPARAQAASGTSTARKVSAPTP